MEFQSPRQPTSNPTHKRQVIWQIWIPLLVVIIVFIGLCVLAVVATRQEAPAAGHWASLSVIMILLPSCLGGIISLIFLVVGIFLSSRIIRGLPPITLKGQIFFFRMASLVRYYTDRLVSPIISVSGKWAGFSYLFKSQKKAVKRKN